MIKKRIFVPRFATWGDNMRFKTWHDYEVLSNLMII